MNNTLKNYIDSQLIRELAYTINGDLTLWSDDLNDHEQANFLDRMMEHDETTKDFLLGRMQQLINQRLPIVDAEDRYDAGFKPVINGQTGEVTWQRGKDNTSQL